VEILLGTKINYHKRDFFKLKIRTSSVRILWTNNEKFLLNESNNIAFLFLLKMKTKFLTTDCKSPKRPFFSIKLENQFMVFPNLNIRVQPIGSEFFSGII
jgi:hypothetical protein